MPSANHDRPRIPRLPVLLAIAAIAVATAAVSLYRLGAANVCGANEAVEGVFVQQMVEHGKLLFPLENGTQPMYKPPLFHWTATAIDRLAGITKVTAFNLRLPSVFYGTAGVILTMAFAYSFVGPGAAIIAGLILAGSYQYIEEARIGRVDMTLCFFETLSLFIFLWWYAPRRSGAGNSTADPPDSSARGSNALPYLLALSLGLGVLSKGPVGMLLPGLAFTIFLIVERRLRDVWKLATPGTVILTVVFAGSWYFACFVGRRYGFLDRQIGSENFGRFFGSLGMMVPWYYVLPLLLNSAPLSLIAPFAVFFAIRTYWRPPGSADNDVDSPSSDYRATTAVRLLAIFWLGTVIFFSIAAYKRRAYLLPLWPPAAVMIAWWLESLIRARWGLVFRNAVGAVCVGLIVFNLFYQPWREVHECGNDSFKTAAAQINAVVGRDEPLYLWRFIDEPAPLLFYLDRNAPKIGGKLGDAPPGYVLVPLYEWRRHKDEALNLVPIAKTTSGKIPLVLLRRGKAYAHR